ncbi:hypothetical protein NPIL_654011, partial [Nephila pilipes]
IVDRSEIPFIDSGENGEFSGTLRTVAEDRLGNLYGGTMSDVKTGHVVMRRDHAQKRDSARRNPMNRIDF